ncbi:hypothetical protein J2D78_11170 [Microbacterium maritypicum]|uniref:hypothetical protein n=1 Tax=Microbacterium maritypicum TaxID=33918 RepID=UPI001B32266E|nr:hypothetical protein [Microbacterium liquefaciens]MBP5802644.1 hypothetical protein [Microbacterium liquefaciens]
MIPPTTASAMSRRSGVLMMVSIVVMLAGCAPTPEPTPTPTAAFASEEEAFAAAEETYRAFTAHLNEVEIADPATFEPLFRLSSGDFEAADRKAYSTMHAEGFVVDGDTKIVSFKGTEAIAPFQTVTAKVCLDVSAVTVTDSAGVSRVDPTRPDIYALDIVFAAENSTFTIDSASVDEEATCAATS